MFDDDIKRALALSSYPGGLSEIMEYAVLPAGKLFRPRLVDAITKDTTGKSSINSRHLGTAIELHHAYTLVHDDLPAMDNDLVRRGKPSTHAKFGEWKAILAGDALLIASFSELMRIRHPEIHELHRLLSWATGAKGLILGQYLDLEADGKMHIQDVVRVHELKTARLIQVAVVGAHILSRETKSLKESIEFFRLGRQIGVTFQLLDDLAELTDETLSAHEKLINPFLTSPQEALKTLRNSHASLRTLLAKHKLVHLDKMLQNYFREGQTKLELKFENVRHHIDRSVVNELEKWITTYV